MGTYRKVSGGWLKQLHLWFVNKSSDYLANRRQSTEHNWRLSRTWFACAFLQLMCTLIGVVWTINSLRWECVFVTKTTTSSLFLSRACLSLWRLRHIIQTSLQHNNHSVTLTPNSFDKATEGFKMSSAGWVKWAKDFCGKEPTSSSCKFFGSHVISFCIDIWQGATRVKASCTFLTYPQMMLVTTRARLWIWSGETKTLCKLWS